MKEIILCRYGSGCFGCCGTEFANSKEQVIKEIKINTRELKDYKDLDQFRMRHGALFKEEGNPFKMCRNITKLSDGYVGCPLHPILNEGEDFRKNYCFADYWCPTMKKFRKWNDKEKKKFLDFLDFKKLDSYEYSIKMDSGELLKEFENQIFPLKIE